MCLINAKPKKLDEPMTVYKVFLIFVEGDTEVIRSPYQLPMVWEIGKEETAGISSDYSKVNIPYLKRSYDANIELETIYGGAFHSFPNKEDAQWMMRDLITEPKDGTYTQAIGRIFIQAENCKRVKVAIGECTIPQDSEYVFDGLFEALSNEDWYYHQLPSIASQKLVLNKIVEELT